MFKRTAIPEPTRDTESIYLAVMALKEAVEVLQQQRKPYAQSVVTWQDLLDLELIEEVQIPT